MAKIKFSSVIQRIKRLFSMSFWRESAQKIASLPWRKWLNPKRIPILLEDIVTVLLRLGTIILITFFLVFFARLFKDQGYILQAFNVPTSLESAGLSGEVLARRFADKVAVVKEKASSIKEDSLLLSDAGEDLNLTVLGVGLSLKSLAYQVQETLGRRNKTITGDVIKMDGSYELQLRMTGMPDIVETVPIDTFGNLKAIDELLNTVAEGILLHTDPYRHALLRNRQKRFDEAIQSAQYLLRERPEEAHWGYLAWGITLEDQGKYEEAERRFIQSTKVDSTFTTAWIRLVGLYNDLDNYEGANKAATKIIEIDPNNSFSIVSYAWMRHKQGEHDIADSLFAVALDLSEDDDNRFNVAMSWAESRMQIDCMQQVRYLVNTYGQGETESSMGYLLKGIVSLADRDTLKAASFIKEALYIDPTSSIAISANINSFFEFDAFREAVNAYQNSVFTDEIYIGQQVYLHNLAAVSYYRLGILDSALIAINKAVSIYPNVGYPYSTKAEIYFLTNELDSCWHYFDKAMQLGYNLNPEDFENDPYPDLLSHPEMQALILKHGQEEVVADIR